MKIIKKQTKIIEPSYSSKGFALIYEDSIFENNVVNKKLNNDQNYVLHSFLKNNTLVTISNPLNAKSIKDIISDYMEGTNLNEINITVNMEQTWKTVVGKTISENTEIIHLKKGTLTIKASNPIWRNEMSLQKKELIDKINKTESKFNIKDIIFR